MRRNPFLSHLIDRKMTSQQLLEGKCNNCIFLVRHLRSRVLKMQSQLVTAMDEDDSPHHLAAILQPVCAKINENYDQLEGIAKTLPDRLPALDKIERLRAIYQEEQGDPAYRDVIEALIDSCNYNEGTYQMNAYLSEFQRQTRRRQSSMVMSSAPPHTDANENLHAVFDEHIHRLLKELHGRKSGIVCQILESSATFCIFELRSGAFTESKQFVCLQKMIIIANNAVIDRAVMIAPHEDWSYVTEYGERRLDLRVESRYLVYRKLTSVTNVHLATNAATISEYKTFFNYIILLAKVHNCLDAVCKTCRRVMKDFLPPVNYDLRNAKQAYHDGCR